MARGDRRDGYLVREADPMHLITPLIWPERCDNEAFIFERLDLTAVNDYLARKNEEARAQTPEGEEVFKYTLFHFVVAAVLKTMTLRPKLNYFYQNKRLYQHKDLSAAFVVKKRFSDDAEEGLAVLKAQPTDNIDSVREFVRRQTTLIRGTSEDQRDAKGDTSSNAMGVVSKLPFFVIRFIVWVVRLLDRHGGAPQFLVESDPYQHSVVLSNLGSIKMKAGYHHLSNWGSTSMFVTIGEKKIRPFFNDDGTYEMRDSLELGITVDERVADGYYFSKTLRLVRKLFAEPELLDAPFSQEVDY